MNIADMVEQISARLPELAWKLNALGSTLKANTLPPALFRARVEITPQSCIDEIKNDLTVLSQQTGQRSVNYLADRIHQKINVLVRLCQVHARKNIPQRQVHFGVQTLSTRQQWLQVMRDDITRLTEQQHALTCALNNAKSTPQALLQLQNELGEAERCLTLAKETYERATRW